MWRTAFASTAVALAAWAGAAWLTHDFQVFTAEGARRLEVQLEPVASPTVLASGPETQAAPLPDLFAGHGAATIVDFVYTRCVAVCAALGSGFQQLQAKIERESGGAAPLVRLLSISFDPAHDDVAALARHAESLNADPRIWRLVTVPDAHALAALLRAFEVVVIPDGLGGYEHNAALLVVDPTGRLVRVFDYTQLDEALHFARTVGSGELRG